MQKRQTAAQTYTRNIKGILDKLDIFKENDDHRLQEYINAMQQSSLINPFQRRGVLSAAINLEELMSHEVQVDNMTFIINSYSRESATETIEQVLKRAIIQNAEREFRNDSAQKKNG